MRSFNFVRILLVAATLLSYTSLPRAITVVRVNPTDLGPTSSSITFSEQPFGTLNPIYPSASFGEGIATNTDSSGIPRVSLIKSVGAGNITLLRTLYNSASQVVAAPGIYQKGVRIGSDGASIVSPVLENHTDAGLFQGPLAVVFGSDLSSVSFRVGYFDAIGTISVSLYDRAGKSLGSYTNTGLGFEFFGFNTSSGPNGIAAVTFSIVKPEPAGYGIDNIQFGSVGIVPEGTSLSYLALGLLCLTALVYGRQKQTIRR